MEELAAAYHMRVQWCHLQVTWGCLYSVCACVNAQARIVKASVSLQEHDGKMKALTRLLEEAEMELADAQVQCALPLQCIQSMSVTAWFEL